MNTERKKAMKRKISLGLCIVMVLACVLTVVPSSSLATGATKEALKLEEKVLTAEGLEKFRLDTLNFKLGDETGFYSWKIKDEENYEFTNDSRIIYKTEDGVHHEFKPLKQEGSKYYSFWMKLDTVGVWKLVSIDGVKVVSDALDLTVFKDEKELRAEENRILEEAIRLGREIDTTRKSVNVTRIAGKDRYDTAVKASRETFTRGSKYVAIATGESYIDGLVGGALTAQERFPLLLVRKNAVTKEVLDEIVRLKPREIFILGGEAAVSKDVEAEIAKLGITIERLAGADRFSTAKAINDKRWRFYNPDNDVLKREKALIYGFNFADALSAGPFVGTMANGNNNFYDLELYKGAVDNAVKYLVFGGPSVIPDGAHVSQRYFGDNRYETALEVARGYTSQTGGMVIHTVVLVSGEDFPDGLTAAGVARRGRGAVLLTQKDVLHDDLAKWIKIDPKIKNVIILGGEAAVSEAIEKEIKNYPAIP